MCCGGYRVEPSRAGGSHGAKLLFEHVRAGIAGRQGTKHLVAGLDLSDITQLSRILGVLHHLEDSLLVGPQLLRLLVSPV